MTVWQQKQDIFAFLFTCPVAFRLVVSQVWWQNSIKTSNHIVEDLMLIESWHFPLDDTPTLQNCNYHEENLKRRCGKFSIICSWLADWSSIIAHLISLNWLHALHWEVLPFIRSRQCRVLREREERVKLIITMY